jgi:hypothetical protein
VVELKELMQQCADYAKQAQLCGTLLWRMAYSGALGFHLTLLHNVAALTIPQNDETDLQSYKAYSKFSYISLRDAVKDAKDAHTRDSKGMDEGVEENEYEDFTKEPSNTIYLNWIHLQDAYFAAADSILEYA